jgi:hypothetical protein
MADIISFDGKIEISREKQAIVRRRQKALAVRRVMQCAGCSLKCEKCGTQIEPRPAGGADPGAAPQVPYRFCEACEEEYLDYIERLQGRGDTDCYWHNEAWLGSWGKWIDYQGSVDQYLKSKEFVKLLQEFKQSRPEQ